MLRMLRKGMEPKKVQEPPKEVLVESTVVPVKDVPVDSEEQHIISLIVAAEKDLQQFRSKQRIEDEEERSTRVVISDIQRSSAALPEGLAAKKLLDAKIVELELKLSGLNIKRQAAETEQAPLIQEIEELQNSLATIDPDGEAAILLQKQIDLLQEQLNLKIAQSVDKTEEELIIRVIELRKRLLKYRVEKLVRAKKLEFIQQLDEDLDEAKANIDDQEHLKQVIANFKPYLHDPEQYAQDLLRDIITKFATIIDATKIKLNAGVLLVIEKLLVKLDDSEDLTLIEYFVEEEMRRLTNKLMDVVDEKLDVVLLEKAQENTKIIAQAKINRKISFAQDALTEAIQIHRRSLNDTRTHTYYRVEYYQALLKFYEQLLKSPLHKYNEAEDEVDDYEKRLETLYFHSTEDGYRQFIKLQSDIDANHSTTSDQSESEIMLLKMQICSVKIMIKEMCLQLQNLRIFDVLTDSDNADNVRGTVLVYISRCLGYIIKLLNFIQTSEEADQLIASFAKLQTDVTDDHQQQLEIKQKFAVCSSQIFLDAMRAHYAYCLLSSNKGNDFSHRMKQYRQLIRTTTREHEDIYNNQEFPQDEFKLNLRTIEELHYLLPLLPPSPIASLLEIVKENLSEQQSVPLDHGSDADPDDWEEASNRGELPPSPPRPPTLNAS